ncbi:MAG: rhomboid family intramembrane serine protease [candidate division Zixibacteria bacterium]|nr:rhomboid family intramembrane serine protease [candidate division Zixibacteria bacterium]
MSQYQPYDTGGTREMRIGPGAPLPFIKWMLIINGGVQVLQLLLRGQMEVLFGLTPQQFFADFPRLVYQLGTYMFLHLPSFPFFHLLFNMLSLWMFGTEIERTWGSRSFAKFYLLAGVAGGLLTLVVTPSSLGPVIGASGAIYGVLVAYWLMFPNRSMFFFPIPIPLKVKWAIPGFMLLGLLFAGGDVAHAAHLGGALFGLLYLKLDWRLLRPGNWIKNLRYERQLAKLERNRRQAESIMKRVDSILDKINEVGIENLTPEERRILEEASSRLSQKDHHSGRSH